jgi:23S rRNA pseudouridine2605 synthase
MFASVGHPVLKLTRIRFGPFSLGKLEPGQYKMVSDEDVKKFLKP